MDIPDVRTVINFDTARDIDSHVHRIGTKASAWMAGWKIIRTDRIVGQHNLAYEYQDAPAARDKRAQRSRC